MPTDISPSFTPTFDSSVPVPDDGDYASHSALADMVRPLANRTEYLRRTVDSDPWRRTEYREDFARVSLDGEVLTADAIWSFYQSGGALQVAPAGVGINATATEQGVLHVQNLSGAGVSALLALSNQSHPATFAQAALLACKVRLDSIASGMGFEFGLFGNFILGVNQPNAEAVSWSFLPATSPNWQFRSMAGGTASMIDTGIPVVAGTYYTLRVDQRTPGTFTGRIDAGAEHTAATNIPAATDVGSIQAKFVTPSSGATRRFLIDHIYGRLEMPGRVL